ncbi:hypothetical protein MTR67_012117 [Solanum verrucosum]|uniref:Integrase zinc-binding domain-containing protein n=1 Tax=Solanum verrucosum TaxID=315347 RepID=A0AAF0Q832_SOLVR|nr:hypothetical protein MTR67_012117 [Solanum verrucosum]
MFRDLQKIYWWNGMNKDIAGFVAKCSNCQQVKVENQRLGGLSQDIIIPTWKWEDLNMDFIVGLPRTQHQYDSIWVIVDRMTKSTHLIPFKFSHMAKNYAKLYLREMTNGQAERKIQILEDMLRAFVIDFKESWDAHFTLIEFAYNKSDHSSSGMTPFEALYDRRSRSPIV